MLWGGDCIPGGLPLPEVVPEYMEEIGADRFEQPQIGFHGDSFKQTGSLIIEAPPEAAPAGCAASRWRTPSHREGTIARGVTENGRLLLLEIVCVDCIEAPSKNSY